MRLLWGRRRHVMPSPGRFRGGMPKSMALFEELFGQVGCRILQDPRNLLRGFVNAGWLDAVYPNYQLVGRGLLPRYVYMLI